VRGLSQRVVLCLSAAALCTAGAVPALAQESEDDTKDDVRLSVSGGRGAQAGKPVRYRFTVRNNGRVAVDSVRVSSRLPRSLKYMRGGRFGSAQRIVAFSLGRIEPGRGQSRVLVARVAKDFEADSRIVLRAKVTARALAE